MVAADEIIDDGFWIFLPSVTDDRSKDFFGRWPNRHEVLFFKSGL
jgi:hypothetical protein